MTLIRQYVNAMQAGDSISLSRLFSSDAIFVDYCPKDAGQAQITAYGPEAIDMFFRNRFIFRKFKILILSLSVIRRYTTMQSMATIICGQWQPFRTSVETVRFNAW